MKKSGVIAASVAAASAISSASSCKINCPREDEHAKKASDSASRGSSSSEKFAPRFDGLRFIETLVTAHR